MHRNKPGVIATISSLVAEENLNIRAQSLATTPDVGYLVMDVDRKVSKSLKKAIKSLDFSIYTRMVY